MILGEVLRKWRRMSDLTVRQAAAEVGLSVATFSRIERGESMDARTLATIFTWLTREVEEKQ